MIVLLIVVAVLSFGIGDFIGRKKEWEEEHDENR